MLFRSKYRPPVDPREPSDQTPAAQIRRGLWSTTPSFRSGACGAAALLVPELVAGRGRGKLKLAAMRKGSRRLEGARGKETTTRRPAPGEMLACGGKLQVAVSAAASWVPTMQVSTSASSSRTDGDLVLTELALSLL